jgi:hypothetical protein
MERLSTLTPRTPTPLYIGVLVPLDVKERLCELARHIQMERGISLEALQLSWHAHHLTLIHKKNQTSPLWDGLLRAVSMRRALQLRIVSLVVGSAGTVIASVEMLDGPEAAQLVATGVPHITVCIPAGTKPGDSATFVQKAPAESVVALSKEQADSLTWVGAVTGLCF